MSKTLVLFDFDGTLTKQDTFNQFVFFSKGNWKAICGYALFSPYIILFFLKITSGTNLKSKMTAYFFKGADEASLKTKGQNFIDYLHHSNRLKEHVLSKLIRHKENNDKVCIVSASLDIWIRPFSERYAVDYLCTEIQYQDGKSTGNLKTPNCNNEEKTIRIKRAYDLATYSKIVAYGNSKGDQAMFDLANETYIIK